MTLQCAECGRELPRTLVCSCGATFRRHPETDAPILIGRASRLDAAAIAATAVRKDLDLERARRHWRAPRLADFLGRAAPGDLLNVGSGDGGDRSLLAARGHRVTGVDVYPAPATDVICDAHSLPFADASFDVVTSISVLQVLHDPFRAVAEIARVLRPGGAFVGTVAFLEPHQDGSFFHMSPAGVRELLAKAFTDVEVDAGWSWLEALAPSFWVWNRVAPLARASRAINAAKYRAGTVLARAYYALRGKPLPDAHRLAWAGALVFYARRR